ncbi:helix-turn-helix domain-containing protein [Anoxybacillus ayderensis]|uniref:helix-turn-helix domain-containing protein n=1 Tax=Anoxybacillus ayderensis TaxID=265546 RepID=UPI002E1B9CD5|nr:helix-turn-helix domain-containing protein [Anoxybacillus ayderensis]MED0657299.1 response regulator [Anoxybacillus ayderensis]MED0687884.1 response regulator [Anoxybacillus ayderensis]
MYKLLIADDEPLEREGLQLMIERAFPQTFTIFHAEHGRSAIQQVEQHRPHIIFMDIKMPGIQGLEAIAEIRKIDAQAKIVILTAYDYFTYAKEAISLGVIEYVLKPTKKQQIVELLQKLLHQIMEEQAMREQQLTAREKLVQLQALSETAWTWLLMGKMDECSAHTFTGMEFEKGYAMVIELEKSDASEREKWEEIVKQCIKQQRRCLCSPLSQRQMAIFIEAEQHERVISFAQSLLKQLEKALQQRVKIGIGTIRSGVDGLKRSYKEAWTAVRYVSSFSRAIHIDDVPITDEVEQIHIKTNGNVIEQVEMFLHENYCYDVTLEEVAKYVHLTPYYFSKLFKKETGQTFIDYLTHLRIEKAKQLMRDEGLTVKEACYRVGYKDPNYFSRVFKKVTNMTPTEYRQEVCERL